MGQRETVAVEVARGQLRAVEISQASGGIRIRRVLVADRPSDIDLTDPEVLGGWIRAQLDSAGMSRRHVVWQIGREHVVVKRLSLPTVAEDELPDMTRYALTRDLPFDASNVIIDFVPMARSERETTVLAAAVPGDAYDEQRALARHAGCRIMRVALRSLGTAALIQTDARSSAERVLAIDLSRSRADFSIVDGAGVHFIRSAELTETSTPEDVIASITTEAQRTWMSYRMADDSSDVARIELLGNGDLVRASHQALAKTLGRAIDIYHEHPLVTIDEDTPDQIWSLAGQLLATARGLPTIDFASPRRPPDRSAQRRKAMLATAGILVLILLGAWTVTKRDLAALQRRVDAVQARNGELGREFARSRRDADQLTHLKYWLAVDEPWIDHAAYLSELAPEPSQIVLDDWAGGIDFRGVQYDRRAKTWSAPAMLSISVSGEARDRAVADAFRESLVRSERYLASSTGNDLRDGRRLAVGFTYTLRAAVRENDESSKNGASSTSSTMTASRRGNAP